MWHKNYPFKRFIKATESSSGAGSTSVKQEESGEGEEEFLRRKGSQIRDFYEELTRDNVKTEQLTVCKREAVKEEEIALSSDEEEEVTVTGDSALENSFLKAVQAGDLDLVRQVLSRGGGRGLLECRDRYGWSPVMIAAGEGRKAVVEFLLLQGADVGSVRDRRGLAALDIARQRGQTEMVELLRESQEGRKSRAELEAAAASREAVVSCDSCGELYAAAERRQHLASLGHQLGAAEAARHDLAPVRPGFALSEANRGFRLLVKSGWDGCSGLGEEGRRGRLFPIKSVLKSDRVGLGGDREGEKAPARVTHFGPRDERSVQFRESGRKNDGGGYCAVCHKKYEADVCGCKERLIRQDLWDLS
jgi:hypothetical protein